MGANVVNTVVEGLSNTIKDDISSICNYDIRIGLRILSNLCDQRKAISSFCIPVSSLKWKGVSGKIVAERIMEAYLFALDDEYRACTNNKGVMNGIDSVCIALGQDWRAIESGAHAYNCVNNGYYGPLCHYDIIKNNNDNIEYLFGYLELPISVGSKGGALQTHPMYQLTHDITVKGNINNELSAKTIAQILVSVGLAQNMGAIRALAIEGIQRGHMSLHAKNIACSIGVPTSLIDEVSRYMVSKRIINKQTAKHYMEARKIQYDNNHLSLYNKNIFKSDQKKLPPSTLFVKLPIKNIFNNEDEFISLNVVLETKTNQSIHIELKKQNNNNNSNNNDKNIKAFDIFGKNVDWFINLYHYLDSVKLKFIENSNNLRSNYEKISSIKLLSILLNRSIQQYMEKSIQYKYYIHAQKFLNNVTSILKQMIDNKDIYHSKKQKK